ncbi:MAG: hypothetical protein L0215_06595 [Gemmataceae bacterium]|nr:hypothetical protein [Gemmataceae bacterium]
MDAERLTGHYVNYRKQASPLREELLPESEFRLFGICARHPQQLLQVIAHDKVQNGVYDCRRGTDVIRLIVARDLPKKEENALLHLFSAAQEQVKYGAEHYRLQSSDTSTIVKQLFGEYHQEGLNMPYTMEDFRREVALEFLEQLSPQGRRNYLQQLTLEERLEGLTEDEIKAYLAKLHQRQSKAKPKRPKRRPR